MISRDVDKKKKEFNIKNKIIKGHKNNFKKGETIGFKKLKLLKYLIK